MSSFLQEFIIKRNIKPEIAQIEQNINDLAEVKVEYIYSENNDKSDNEPFEAAADFVFKDVV